MMVTHNLPAYMDSLNLSYVGDQTLRRLINLLLLKNPSLILLSKFSRLANNRSTSTPDQIGLASWSTYHASRTCLSILPLSNQMSPLPMFSILHYKFSLLSLFPIDSFPYVLTSTASLCNSVS